jgi:hypothetical protein
MNEKKIRKYWYKIRADASNSGNPRVPYRILNLQGSCMLRYTCRLTSVLLTVLSFTCAGQGWVFHTPQGPTSAVNATNPARSQNRHKITGTVVNSVTGEPVGRAAVRINGITSQQVFTDSNGRFEANDVPEGQIAVAAQRPGFIDSQMTGHQPQMITVGPTTPAIQVKLIPESILKGTVTNSDGEPLENVGVQVMTQQITNGHKDWSNRGGTQTDENGEYQVEDLPPGQYLIHTSTSLLFPMSMMAENGPLNEVYPPQYFPNATSQESAQPVTVQPGQTAEADFRLSSAPSYSISGVVSGPQANALACEDEEGNPIVFSSRINHRTGQFKLIHIPSGSCTVTARSQGPDGHTYYAEQPVTVNSSNISNVQLVLQSLPEIPVHFSNSNGGVPVQLYLVPRHKRWRNRQFYPTMQGGPSETQTPVFKDIPPGSYRVVAQSFNNSSCVGAITSGSTDLLREDLTVVGGNAQTAPIEVSMSSGCATLTLSTTTTSPAPELNVYYLLTSGSAGIEPRVTISANGNLDMSGLTPGEYTAYAFSDISDLEYDNPDVLREFPGQKVTLGPSEKATVQLNLITRGGSQ